MGYKYGTGWLFKGYPKQELDAIIEEIEDEEQKRIEDLGEPEFDINEDNQEMLKELEGKFDNPLEVIALMRHLGMEYNEVDDVEEKGSHYYKIQGNDYYCGEDSELEDIAREYIEIDQWKEAVANDDTELGFEDWKYEVLRYDGWESILNSWNGTKEEECVFDVWLSMCEA